ncbi:unnamed protein product [Prunus armeniaca]
MTVGWLFNAPLPTAREVVCHRMEWHGLSGFVVATPTWCHAQACRAAGSDRLRGLLNRKEAKNNPNAIVSTVRRWLKELKRRWSDARATTNRANR